MTSRTSFIGIIVLGVVSLAGCGETNSPTEAEPITQTQTKTDPVATKTQSSRDALASRPASMPEPVKADKLPSAPPAPNGLFSFESVSPIGTKSRTAMLARRSLPSGHRVATLQIDRADSAMLMDIGFDCSARTYVYLHMDHNARPVDAAKIARVQVFSDKQLTAFSRGEALQKLTFSKLDTFPPEDVTNYTRIMKIACEH